MTYLLPEVEVKARGDVVDEAVAIVVDAVPAISPGFV